MNDFFKAEFKRLTSYAERDADNIWRRGNNDVNALQKTTSDMLDVVKPPSPPSFDSLRALHMTNQGNTFNNSGQNQIGSQGEGSRAQANTFNQLNEKQDLATSAKEIQALLKQLEDDNPHATLSEKIKFVNDETTLSFKRRVAGALKAGGEAAIEEFLDNPYINVGKEIVKGWLDPR
jgi:hypothetical protein